MPKGGRRRGRHIRYRRLVQAPGIVSTANVIMLVHVLKLRGQRLCLLVVVVPIVEVMITAYVVQPGLTVSGPLFVHFVQLVDSLF